MENKPVQSSCTVQASVRSRTDTERLEFLMQFFEVADCGDEDVCPGMIVSADDVSKAFDYGPLSDETVTLMDGWINPDMRRVIDKAMDHAANQKLNPAREPSTG